jgi:hypothetical protein
MDIQNIITKLDSYGLIRHVNGNTLDNRKANLQRVTATEALNNKDWVVDAVCILNKKEFKIWEENRNQN